MFCFGQYLLKSSDTAPLFSPCQHEAASWGRRAATQSRDAEPQLVPMLLLTAESVRWVDGIEEGRSLGEAESMLPV